jgi:hypothetical protein
VSHYTRGNRIFDLLPAMNHHKVSEQDSLANGKGEANYPSKAKVTSLENLIHFCLGFSA